MISQIITTFGLVLDIVGAGVLFFYASPQPSFEEGISSGLEDGTVLPNGKTVAQHNYEVWIEKKQYMNISKLGLVLIIIGFAFQVVGTWVK